jgi:hypothetical protein
LPGGSAAHDVLTAYDLDLTVHGRSFVLHIRRNKYHVAGSEDAFFAAHPDSKLARDHVDQLFLGVFVQLGSSSSGKAISPDFDLRPFDVGPSAVEY